ncbi:MAG: Rieske 2Fe-2S domain-containing protein [Alphaproteobacteria bacterium]|nr:Rieske 2Fe-2S domain-containing protein [Alphaproteobacteria bacterium]
METVRVGSVEEFGPAPAKKVVEVAGMEVGVFRLEDGFHAWRNDCPHQGGPVCQGRIYRRVLETLDTGRRSLGRRYDEERINIVCPWHGLEYDIRTGRHPGNEGLALESVAVQVQGGEVYVSL